MGNHQLHKTQEEKSKIKTYEVASNLHIRQFEYLKLLLIQVPRYFKEWEKELILLLTTIICTFFAIDMFFNLPAICNDMTVQFLETFKVILHFLSHFVI